MCRRAARAAWVALASTFCLQWTTSTALANPEGAPFDTRSWALGTAGVAFIDHASAVAINPANLEGVEKLALSANAPLAIIRGRAPLDGEDSSVSTPWAVAPFPSLFFAGRISERFVIGAGVYLLSAFGSRFDDVETIYGRVLPAPQDYETLFVSLEASVAASIRILDRLRVGLALRLPYASLDSTQPIFLTSTGPPLTVRQRQRGFGAPGIRLGFTYLATEDVHVGFSYRSQTRIELSGHMSVVGLEHLFREPVTASSAWVSAHMLQVGIAGYLLEHRLMLVADYRVQLHEGANDELRVTLDDPNGILELIGGAEETIVPLGWRTVHVARVGIEGRLRERGALRLGLVGFNSATTHDGAQFFAPPPGGAFTLTLGGGASVRRFEIDAVVGYSHGGTHVAARSDRCMPDPQVRAGCPGRYEAQAMSLGLGLVYRR